MKVDATEVGIDADDPEFIVVGFAWGDHYLTFQRSYEFDEQDVELGMDTYRVERDDQKFAAYGGIVHFELRRDRASILLDAATARKLGGEPEYDVRFDLEDERFEELRAGLAAVFEGFECFVDLS